MNDDPMIDKAYADGKKHGCMDAYTIVLSLLDMQVGHGMPPNYARVLRAKVQLLHDEAEGKTIAAALTHAAQKMDDTTSTARGLDSD